MRSIMKYLAAFVVGGGVGILIAMKMLRERYAELAQDEIDSVKKHFSEVKGGDVLSFVNTMIARGMESEEVEKLYDMLSKYDVDKEPEEVVPEVVKRDYKQKASMYSSISSLTGVTADMNAKKEKYNLYSSEGIEKATFETYKPINPMLYLIDEEDYSTTLVEQDKLRMTYFAGDDIMIDEDENIIDNVDEIIGYDLLIEGNDEQGTPVYVRNLKNGEDYEVTIRNGYYREEILGLTIDKAYLDEIKNKNKKDVTNENEE